MNIVCKCCGIITFYPNMEYFCHIKTLGFPLCLNCNNCADCGNYICNCLRCSDCWLVLMICRCDNGPESYERFAKGREQDPQIENLIHEMQNCHLRNNQINSINNTIHTNYQINELIKQIHNTNI